MAHEEITFKNKTGRKSFFITISRCLLSGILMDILQPIRIEYLLRPCYKSFFSFSFCMIQKMVFVLCPSSFYAQSTRKVINITTQSSARNQFAQDCLFITSACICGYACILQFAVIVISHRRLFSPQFGVKFPETVPVFLLWSRLSCNRESHLEIVVINGLSHAVSVAKLIQ